MGTEQFVRNKVPEFKEVKVKSKLEENFPLNNNRGGVIPTGNSQSRGSGGSRGGDDKEKGGEGSQSDFGDIEFADVDE